MTYAITKKFVSGLLEGIEYKCLTGVKFEEGKRYGDYIITSCFPVTEETNIQMTAFRPSKYGGGEAFTTGTYEYIQTARKQWAASGYYNIHCWAD